MISLFYLNVGSISKDISLPNFGIPLALLFLIDSRNYKNRAATVITGRKNEHGQSELALDELKWKPLNERRTHFVASLMYKITHELAPKRLIDLFQWTPSSYYYNMRGFSTERFSLKPKTEYL